jgi:hypothetical protein
METNRPSSNNYLVINQIIFYGLLSGLLLFAVFVAYIHSFIPVTPELADYKEVILATVIVFCFGEIMLGRFIFRKKLEPVINKETKLKIKLETYRMAMIVNYALIESAAIFAMIFYLLTAYAPLFVIAGLLIVYLILIRPNKESLFNDLKLDDDEIARLDNPDWD